MFQVTLTSYGQTQISSKVLIEGIILLYDYIENIDSLTSISSYTQNLDESACGNLKGTVGNVRIQDISNSEYQSKTILFYKIDNNEKKILGGYSQETPIIQKTSTDLSLFLSFDFSAFTNGFLFSSIQAGYPVASANNDGLVHIENPNIVSDNSYSVYSKDQVDTLLVFYVPTSRKVNNKALSSDVTLTLDDVADGTSRKIPTEISELSPNDIGANLVSDHDTSWDLGSDDHRWRTLYIESIGTTTNKCSYIYASRIGSSSYPVTSIYATDIYGSLTGNASTSSTADGLFKTVTDDSSGETVTTTHSVSLNTTDTVKKWDFSDPISTNRIYFKDSYGNSITSSYNTMTFFSIASSSSMDKYSRLLLSSGRFTLDFVNNNPPDNASTHTVIDIYSDKTNLGSSYGHVEIDIDDIRIKNKVIPPSISFSYPYATVSSPNTTRSKVAVESRTETIDSTDVTVYDLNTYIYNNSGNSNATPRYSIYCDSDLVSFFNKNGLFINSLYNGSSYTGVFPTSNNNQPLGSSTCKWGCIYVKDIGSSSSPVTSIYGRLDSLYGTEAGSIFFFKLIITNNSSTDITVPRGVSLTNTIYFGSTLLSIVSYEEKVDESSSSYGIETFTGTFYTLLRFTVTANASLVTVYVPCLRYS